MIPFGQQMGGGQMAPVFVPAHGPPPYGYYPFMGPQPIIHTAPPPGGPSSPSQPGAHASLYAVSALALSFATLIVSCYFRAEHVGGQTFPPS